MWGMRCDGIWRGGKYRLVFSGSGCGVNSLIVVVVVVVKKRSLKK